MTTLRKIKRVVTGRRTTDGAGVSLVRVFGYHDARDFDPFLMLDAFDSTNPEDYTNGFPWHPHRGIETITYLLAGDIEHQDSLGNKGNIKDGDCQWMTAGSGIIHQEMPLASSAMKGAQLWLNLPSTDKMTTPAYGDIRHDAIPVVQSEGLTIKIVSGNLNGKKGAFGGQFIDATYLDVELAAGAEWSYTCNPDSTLFIYIFDGSAIFDPTAEASIDSSSILSKQAVLFSSGDQFWVKAGHEGIRFILLSGQPLREPIAWGGPVVMNTQEELNQAFSELESGHFIK